MEIKSQQATMRCRCGGELEQDEGGSWRCVECGHGCVTSEHGVEVQTDSRGNMTVRPSEAEPRP